MAKNTTKEKQKWRTAHLKFQNNYATNCDSSDSVIAMHRIQESKEV